MSLEASAAAMRVAAVAQREIPSALLQVGGRALYSPASTLVSGSPFYFLGVNPCEVPDAIQLHAHITVGADLERLKSGAVTEHGYLDEQWKGHMPGGAPMQVRGQQVFALLAAGTIEEGRNLLRITPTSNFILQRSPSVEVLEQRTGVKAWSLALQYWPFHQAVIHETGCVAVVTHAIGLAREFAKSLGLGEGLHRDSGWGGTLSRCYAWQLPNGPMLLAIPSLSRYKPDGPRATALAAFFREFLPGTGDFYPQTMTKRFRSITGTEKPILPDKCTTSERDTSHICEQLVEAALYLKSVGMTGAQLSQLHHDSLVGKRVSFSKTCNYFSRNTDIRPINVHYAERLKYVAAEHRRTGDSLGALAKRALARWPLQHQGLESK